MRSWLVVALAALPGAGCGGPASKTAGGGDGAVMPHGDGAVTSALDSSVAGDGGLVPDAATTVDGSMPATRDPLTWPFSSTSIWNTPIGSAATYTPAGFGAPSGGFNTDEDLIVLQPTAPMTPVYYSSAAWTGASRCTPTSQQVLLTIPLPASFVITSDGQNDGLVALASDGRTLLQTQPFARCTTGGQATSYAAWPGVDLYGDGIPGAHGGSGLSAIGGTLRVGELRPTSGHVRHVLKAEAWAMKYFAKCMQTSSCYRWPALAADDYAPANYGGTNAAVQPGSLLALPTSINIDDLALATAPAKEVAWTLQNYGAYIVDDTAWDSYALCTESGPAGRFTDQFQSDWGVPFNDPVGDASQLSGFGKDIVTLFEHLSVVTNNAQSTVGGGGTPLQPLAPPITAP